jgi:hypothetical protein
MATFIERACAYGEYESDGGAIDINAFMHTLVLWNEDQISSAQLHGYFACTPAQEAECEEILATRPGGGLARVQWASRVIAKIWAGGQFQFGLVDAASVRAALGLA